VQPKTRYADSGGVKIAYQVVGDGPIDFLIVPGFVSHLEIFWEEPGLARTLERLASFSRLILFDRRGMGLSDREAGTPALEATIDDARAVLDVVGSERAVVEGVSEGGAAALLFAATYPDRTRSLILFGSYARVVSAPDYPEGFEPQALEAMIHILTEGWGEPVALDLFAPSMATDPRFRDWWARLLRNGTSPSGVRDLLGLYLHLDARHALAAVRAPTLVIHRRGDRVVPVQMGRYIAERIAGSKFVELPGADHLLWTEQDGAEDAIVEFLTGAPRLPETDRMLATVMFTDIVGSTDHAIALGDRRWRDLLDSHDRLVRKNLELFRGREVKTVGDGFLATFDGPARAIRCAKAIAGEVSTLGLRIRAGLHTGECEVLNGDLGGIAVHIAARVAETATPDQVLVSSTVKDLVAGSGVRFEDRGAHALKGIPDEWRLFSVAS
jgi:class 3 adenylate cyclase